MVVIKLPEAPDDFDYPIENDLGKNISEKVSQKLNQFSPKEIPAATSWDDIYKL
ncbi:MAG: hypothetical protein PHY93_17890 [Bacteriovorax sp.]|nr:hypothetical protein [Bacteriovorax sp.]